MKQKLPWILLTVVIIVAVILQAITYTNYKKLHTAVDSFLQETKSAKNSTELNSATEKFIQGIQPLITLSKSQAAIHTESDTQTISRTIKGFFCGGCVQVDGATCCGNSQQ